MSQNLSRAPHHQTSSPHVSTYPSHGYPSTVSHPRASHTRAPHASYVQPSHNVSHAPVQTHHNSARTLSPHHPVDNYNHHPMTVSYRPHSEVEVHASPRMSYVQPSHHVSQVQHVPTSPRRSVRHTPAPVHHEPTRVSYSHQSQVHHPAPVHHEPHCLTHGRNCTPDHHNRRLSTDSSDHDTPVKRSKNPIPAVNVQSKKKNMRHNVPAPGKNYPKPGCCSKNFGC